LLEKCSKHNRTSKILKIFRLRRAAQYTVKYLGKLVPRGKLKNLCYIAGKVLQIQPKIKNPQKFSPAAGSAVYSYLGKLVPRGKLKNVCYIAGKVLQIQPKIKNPQKFSPAAGSSVYSYLGKLVPPRKIEKLVLHCWKNASNTTKDQKFSKKFACGGQFSVILSSESQFLPC